MTVELNQTLHGYNNGHELLAASLQLDSSDSKTLLFLSDLSGSNVVAGFEEYISGYPLNGGGYYALSKTWYAPEMNRPGCVWTHTVLISYGDLGKMVDLSRLLSLFVRPIQFKYSQYTQRVQLELPEVVEQTNNESFRHLEKQISSLLYGKHDAPIAIPSSNSSAFDKIILAIWSNQWPRLRRNFLFCTGSISLRRLDSRSFDIQIVPAKNLSLLKREDPNLIFFENSVKIDPIIEYADRIDSDKLRSFLWTFGSDIGGNRGNYLNLLKLIILLNDARTIDSLVDLLLKVFPDQKDAALLKTSLFTATSDLAGNFSERDVIKFLTTTPDETLQHFNITPPEIAKRVLTASNKESLPIKFIAEVWDSAKPGRIDEAVWDNINLTPKESILLIQQYDSLTEVLVRRTPSVMYDAAFWRLSQKQQNVGIALVLSLYKSLPSEVIKAMLQAESALIFNIPGSRPDLYYGIFDWLNNEPHARMGTTNFQARILNDNYSDFKQWLKGVNRISRHLFDLIFRSLEVTSLQKLDAPVSIWTKSLDENKNSTISNYSQCIILSIGFLNRTIDADILVSKTFESVYALAERGELTNDFWKIVKRDDSMDDDDDDSGFWSIFNIGFRRKKEKVPYWDYCESLIRIASANFVRNRWSHDTFLNTFTRKDVFGRTIEYLLTYKKGQQYVIHLVENVFDGKVRSSKIQATTLKEIIEN